MKNISRCHWCSDSSIYIDYHDNEWGVPVYEDQKLFEMLILEGFQAGLSWMTILKKRNAFNKAFDHFNLEKILNYDDKKIDELMNNKDIIRHKLKILSVINNAKAFIKIQKEFGSFSDYLWKFVNHQPIFSHFQSFEEVPTHTPLSDEISKDLKRRGFKFVGTTIIYAYLQAVGLINNHTRNCFKYQK